MRSTTTGRPTRCASRAAGEVTASARPPLHWAVRDVSAEVTVVIPTRDRPALLADALASVAAQDHPPARTIVVDDGSAQPPTVVGRRRGGGPPAGARLGRGRGAQPRARARRDGVGRVPRRRRPVGAGQARAPARGRDAAQARRSCGARSPWSTSAAGPSGLVPAADPAALLPRLVRTNVIGSPSAVLARTELVRAVGGFDEELAAAGRLGPVAAPRGGGDAAEPAARSWPPTPSTPAA